MFVVPRKQRPHEISEPKRLLILKVMKVITVGSLWQLLSLDWMLIVSQVPKVFNQAALIVCKYQIILLALENY